jgi:DNA-directed RNA polymerase specialized sigma24 family protein
VRQLAVDQLTESPTADTPSANPLDLLPLRQLVVFVAHAHRRTLSELAQVLGVHRDTVHEDLRSAIRTLSERGTPAPEWAPCQRQAERTT